MRKFARFAVTFLSFIALHAHAADLRTLINPAEIAPVFPATAKLRVVNVWALWCAPCVAEMPDFRAMDAAFGSEVAFVGVNMDDMLPGATAKPVKAFLDKQKIAYPNIYYRGNIDTLGKYLDFNGSLPFTIVYDGKGKELWRHDGRIDREKMIAKLRDLLRRKS
jgi:thiol-disulfide isomerase/thioredoxin